MKCDLCQGHYVEKTVVLSFNRDGKAVVIESVPALVCDRCGDKLFSLEALSTVQALLENEPQATAPLYRYPQKVASGGWDLH